jgi:hypothetical protein
VRRRALARNSARRDSVRLALAAPPCAVVSATVQAVTIEGFAMQPETRWRFLADGVSGGASTGQVAFVAEGGGRLCG